jgi:hypothetical protein
MGTGGSFQEIKRLGREDDHSLPFSAEDKNVLNNISTIPVPLHGVVLS